MSIDGIYNFIQVDDLTATSGQPTADQFRAAREAGYEVVINLAPDGLETSLPGQRELLGDLGFDYRHIPVAWSGPNLDHFAEFASAMETAAGRRTLIHCQANYRVTAFFGLYAQTERGWTAEQADALMDRIWKSRPDFEMDDTWKGFLAAARAL